jgi:hypothetical protein
LPAAALGVTVALVLAVAARADVPCALPGVGSFAVADDGLDVVHTDRADLRVGDRLLQLNGRRLTSCADLVTALQDAQRQGIMAVVALRRGEAVQTVLLTLPSAPVAAVPIATPPAVAASPPLAGATPTLPLLRSNPEALVPMLAALNAFADQIHLPLAGPQPYGRRFEELQALYRQQRARGEALAAVDPIMSYYEAVATMLNYRERVEAERVTRDGARAPGELARVHMPAAVVEYTTASEVGEWLRRYPFLEPSITRKPGWMGQAEYSGLWKPDEAIRLLVERARSETAALAQ